MIYIYIIIYILYIKEKQGSLKVEFPWHGSFECHSRGMSRRQSNGMSKQRNVTAKECQSKGMPQPRNVKAKKYQSKGVSQPRDVKANSCHMLSQQMAVKVSTVTFWGMSARKLRFNIFRFHFLRDVSHESFVFTSSTFSFWGMSHTKASFSHSTFSFWGISRMKALFSHLPLSLFEGCLAPKLRFHSSTFRIWGMSCTKASFSHLSLALFQGSLARKLRFLER